MAALSSRATGLGRRSDLARCRAAIYESLQIGNAGPPPMAEIEILYRDADVVAVNKPSGLAVHRGWADDDAFAMTLVRDALGQWVYPVHRLDRSASGVLLFALSSAAARVICARFEQHEVEKRYLALVRGVPPETIVVDHALRPDNSDVPQPAVT